jgi:phosphoenolpyruvate synthase/pyruvate phosphate dikinase
MNNHQNSQPEIKPHINGEGGVNPLIAKLRRKLGLTYVVSNPFRVPVAQSAIALEGDVAKRAKK